MMDDKLHEYLREADALAAKAKSPSGFGLADPGVVALANAVELLAHAIRELANKP